MDVVKRLRPALREPRAVALECRKVVVDHFILRGTRRSLRRSPGDRSLTVAALLGVAVESIGAATVRERLPDAPAAFSSFACVAAGVMSNLCHLTISFRTSRSTSRRCAAGAPAFPGGATKYRPPPEAPWLHRRPRVCAARGSLWRGAAAKDGRMPAATGCADTRASPRDTASSRGNGAAPPPAVRSANRSPAATGAPTFRCPP